MYIIATRCSAGGQPGLMACVGGLELAEAEQRDCVDRNVACQPLNRNDLGWRFCCPTSILRTTGFRSVVDRVEQRLAAARGAEGPSGTQAPDEVRVPTEAAPPLEAGVDASSLISMIGQMVTSGIQDAGKFAEDVFKLEKDETTSFKTGVEPTMITQTTAPVSQTTPIPPPRRPLWPWVVGGGVLVAGIGAFIFWPRGEK